MRNLMTAWRGLPALVRFLVTHAAVGFGLAAIFVVGFLLADPHGAGTVLLGAAGHWWPAVALWFFTGLTFGGVQIGAATMLMANDETPRPPRGRGVKLGLAPALLRVRAGRRR